MRCELRALLLTALLACGGGRGEPCLRHSDCAYGEVCLPTGACLAPIDAADGDADPGDADPGDADVDAVADAAAVDAGVDAPIDAAVDAPIDAPIDAPVDAAIDAPVDAAPLPPIRHPEPTGPASEEP